MRSQTLAAVVAVSLFSIAPGRAEAEGLILRQRVTTTGVRPKTYAATQYWTANRVVTDSPDNRVIVDLGAKTRSVADKRQKIYFTQTFAEMQLQAEAMEAAMRKKMENMPPQARETMRKMGTGPEAAVSVKPTGKSEKIAGYEAKEYAIEGGPMTASVWATDALTSAAGAKAQEAMGKMMAGVPGSKFAQAFGQVKGVPLRTTVRSAAGGAHGFGSTTEVVEVTGKTPPTEVMEVPAGFKEVAAPEIAPLHGKGAPIH